MQDLRSTVARPGRIEWIGLRPARRMPVQSVPEVQVHPLVGVIGDHGKQVPPRLKALTGEAGEEVTTHANAPAVPGSRGRRQVTLIQAEHLPVIAALAGLDAVQPEQLRRNIVVSGVPLLALKERRFQIGSADRGWVVLEGTGECHPCSRMEEEFGEGGYNAVRGHGGLTARVIHGGVIRVGDALIPLD